jgi:TRAP transporter TAXI family solute receptor
MKRLITRRTALVAAPLLLAPVRSWAAPANWPTLLVIGTAAPGGTYIVYGKALAKILTDTLGVTVTAQSTQGPDQNIVLLETGTIQLGMVTMGPALQGWNGTGEWTRGKQYRVMRAIFPMYDTPFHNVVLKGSGIGSMKDMAGKHLGVGPKGGSAGTYYPSMLKTLNLEVAVRNGAWSEVGKQLQEKQLDMLAVALGVPFPFLLGLEKQLEIESIAFTPDEIATLHTAIPELSPSVVPAGTYTSLKSDYPTIGMYNFAVAHKDLPDDLVYAIVKAVFDKHDLLVAAHSSAKETRAANVTKNDFLPFHPGAVRYYKDIGIALPDDLTKTM